MEKAQTLIVSRRVSPMKEFFHICIPTLTWFPPLHSERSEHENQHQHYIWIAGGTVCNRRFIQSVLFVLPHLKEKGTRWNSGIYSMHTPHRGYIIHVLQFSIPWRLKARTVYWPTKISVHSFHQLGKLSWKKLIVNSKKCSEAMQYEGLLVKETSHPLLDTPRRRHFIHAIL